MHVVAASLLLALQLAPERKVVEVSSTTELRAALAVALPGTTIVVRSGSYERVQIVGLKGAPGKPIVLANADAASPATFRGLQLSDVEYVELHGLHVEGAPENGLNIDDAGSFDTPSHHVVLRGVTVRNCGKRGNEDGIKLSGLDEFCLESCTVETWGRGGSAVDMVGCHSGVIEGCTFRDREDDPAATGVQTKGGTRDITVRGCRFENAGQRAVNVGGSTALAYFRPKAETFEAKDITIEGCTFLGSEAPIAFVGVDGAVVRWNTFYRPRKWFVRILQETREPGFVPCRNGTFTDNLVAWRSDEVSTPVNVGPSVALETFEFARNYWYCIDAPTRSIPRLPVPEKGAAGGTDPLFRNASKGDLHLAEASPAQAHGAEALPITSKR